METHKAFLLLQNNELDDHVEEELDDKEKCLDNNHNIANGRIRRTIKSS